MVYYLTLREYEKIVREALQELCVGSRCKLLTSEELPDSFGWSVELDCEGSILTISGLEDVFDPHLRKAMKNRIKAAICQRLDLCVPLKMPERLYSAPLFNEMQVLF